MKNFSMKSGIWATAAISSLLLAGCNANDATTKEARDVVKTALRAREIGKSFDAAMRSYDGNATEKLIRHCDELRAMGAKKEADSLSVSLAEKAVEEASKLDISARAAGISSTRKAELDAQSAQKYRLALRLSPDFSSQDHNMLNALGYFLADRGTSTADFTLAEKLTRRSLQRMDELEKSQLSLLASPEFSFTRANVRDSLAWSLYRQKRFAEARREQQKALHDARLALASGVPDLGGEALNEMNAHWQKINEALGLPTATPSDGLPSASPTPEASPTPHDTPPLQSA